MNGYCYSGSQIWVVHLVCACLFWSDCLASRHFVCLFLCLCLCPCLCLCLSLPVSVFAYIANASTLSPSRTHFYHLHAFVSFISTVSLQIVWYVETSLFNPRGTFAMHMKFDITHTRQMTRSLNLSNLFSKCETNFARRQKDSRERWWRRFFLIFLFLVSGRSDLLVFAADFFFSDVNGGGGDRVSKDADQTTSLFSMPQSRWLNPGLFGLNMRLCH